MNSSFDKSAIIDWLLSPKAVRERSRALADLALKGKTHFEVHLDRLDHVANEVLQVTRQNYPDGKIPFHSRWGHFQVGGVDRIGDLNRRISHLDSKEIARIKLDLAVVSVLLDAGAGMGWKYICPTSGKTLSKSEGLAVASLNLFLEGAFSSDPSKLQCDAKGLQQLTEATLIRGFQVTESNPLVGVAGRVRLLNDLGKTLTTQWHSRSPFLGGTNSRPGQLVDFLWSKYPQGITAASLLSTVLWGLGPIWPGRLTHDGIPLGDTWRHPLLGSVSSTDSLIPFHKLSQWMTYSLMEPLMEGGLAIHNLDGMTGLPEYRNGGLLLDLGLITLRDPENLNRVHRPDSELIIEWRALTVTLLDDLAQAIRQKLGKSVEELPLVKILEGGTWHTGRKVAARLRSDGGPPLKIESDGTVF